MPGYQISVSKSRKTLLPILLVVVTVSGISSIISVLFWKLHFDGGFSWSSDPLTQFSWHPLLLTISIVLMSFSSVIYRILPHPISRKTIKGLHASFMILSLATSIIGLWAVFESHNHSTPPIPHMFSLHSWIGVSTLGFFAIQITLGTKLLNFDRSILFL